MAVVVGNRPRVAGSEVRLRQEPRRRGAVPVEIVWSALTRTRLREIRAYVARDKPEAAERLALRIVAMVEALRNHPHLGRVGAEAGIRELVVGNSPYIVLYRLRGQRVTISTIWHRAQQQLRL